jgi:hypothetical protein
MQPASFKPRREPVSPGGVGLPRPAIQYPTTGIAVRCARAASGHAARPPIAVTNSRRLIVTGMGPFRVPRCTPVVLSSGSGMWEGDKPTNISIQSSSVLQDDYHQIGLSLRIGKFAKKQTVSSGLKVKKTGSTSGLKVCSGFGRAAAAKLSVATVIAKMAIIIRI